MDGDLLDIPAMATWLGMSEEWVRLRVKRREIPFHRIGKRAVRFTADDRRQLVEAGFCPALNGELAAPHGPRLVHPPSNPNARRVA